MEEILFILDNKKFTTEENKKIISICKKNLKNEKNEKASLILKKHIRKYFNDIKNDEEICIDIYETIHTFDEAMVSYEELINQLKITNMKIKRADYYVETTLEISFDKFQFSRYYSGDNENSGTVYYYGVVDGEKYYLGNNLHSCEGTIFNSEDKGYDDVVEFYDKISIGIKMNYFNEFLFSIMNFFGPIISYELCGKRWY